MELQCRTDDDVWKMEETSDTGKHIWTCITKTKFQQ